MVARRPILPAQLALAVQPPRRPGALNHFIAEEGRPARAGIGIARAVRVSRAARTCVCRAPEDDRVSGERAPVHQLNTGRRVPRELRPTLDRNLVREHELGEALVDHCAPRASAHCPYRPLARTHGTRRTVH
jgi:hypothetical protein